MILHMEKISKISFNRALVCNFHSFRCVLDFGKPYHPDYSFCNDGGTELPGAGTGFAQNMSATAIKATAIQIIRYFSHPDSKM